jgi:hypothetical protein
MRVRIQEFVDKWKIAIPQDLFIDMMKAQLNDKTFFQLNEEDFDIIKTNYNKIYGKVL